MKNKNSCRSKLAVLALLFLLTGMFLAGMGLQRYIMNQEIRSSYKNSSLTWKQEMAEGMEVEDARDLRNWQLVNSMNYVSMAREIYFDSANGAGEARISIGEESNFGCTVTLIRDATGEEIYQSDMIEPGYYIESIYLSGSLKQGYYPCTAIWSFYTDNDEYVGEMARKTVVVINQ